MRLLTVAEACARLSVGRSQFYSLVRLGRLRTVPIGKRGVRVPESELDRFVREGMGETTGTQEA